MAAAEVELISDRHERRDSLAEFRKLESDISLETEYSNGLNSDNQSIPSAPPSSAGVDGNAFDDNNMFAYSKTYADLKFARHNSENNIEDINDNTENDNLIHLNNNGESIEEKSRPVQDTDSSSTKSLYDSLRDVKDIKTNDNALNTNDKINDANNEIICETNGEENDPLSLPVDNHEIQPCEKVNVDEDKTNEHSADEHRNNEQIQPPLNGLDEKKEFQNNPNFVSPFSFHNTEMNDIEQNYATNNNTASELKHENIIAEKTPYAHKEKDKEENDDIDSSDDESFEKHTRNAMPRKKTEVVTQEFQSSGKKTKTKICTIL